MAAFADLVDFVVVVVAAEVVVNYHSPVNQVALMKCWPFGLEKKLGLAR